MKFATVTTYALRHWETHAQRCVESYRKHWPAAVGLREYTDEALEHASPWLAAFKKRHARRPTENFKFDAVRFAHKVAAIEIAAEAALELGTDVLIWMDADCVTHADVSVTWLEGLIREADFAYLSREPRKYPECGFMMFRLNKRGLAFIRAIAKEYATDGLFNMVEWHDSWVINVVRERLERMHTLKCTSLSGPVGARTHHPLVNGPLGAKLDHLKGGRKAEGRSRPADIRVRRNEPYWRKEDEDMTERYNHLPALIAADGGVNTIIEIGVHRAARGKTMLEAALRSHPGAVRYLGFDVFETLPQAFHEEAMNGKGIATQAEAAARLRDVVVRNGARGRATFELRVGKTEDTLHGKTETADFVFLDGDHRLECIRRDYEAVKTSRTVVFDDYYVPDEGGAATPIDLEVFGCNRLVDELGQNPAMSVQLLTTHKDPCKHGGRIVLAVVRHA